MTAVTLFGIALAPLYAALATVESDNGKTSLNIYQIDDGRTDATSVFVRDVNRILRIRRMRGLEPLKSRDFVHSDVFDREKSEEMMRIYWAFYGHLYELRTGKKVSEEVLARIHNGGPSGWNNPKTERYWTKVLRELRKARR